MRITSPRTLFPLFLFMLMVLFLTPVTAKANWSAGVGAAQGQSPYRGVSSNPNTIPGFVSYRGRFAYIRGLEAGINAWGTGGSWGGVQASVLVKGRLAGYSSSDSSYLNGMESRDWSLDGGLGFSGRVNGHQFAIKGVHDLLNKHQGYEFSSSYSYGFKVTEKLRLSPGVALSWQSSELLDYYFGVTESEARSDRREYQVDSGWEPSITLNTLYSFSQKTSVMIAAKTSRLPDSVVDSPLVNREWVTGVFAALMYRF
ncbi:MipA/OmpV family protein [Marinospirillum sp.]|uniref:MipA/OmpV family protein n=1 Tax=Marinospirillum sp. TaxID=2183934 RepID=UPI002870B149|nr:MipA/OmpV family protein [Marinospirillum sp.]MDR9468352.1 MipA/OmpV family protein [Marinospirillum sp.]